MLKLNKLLLTLAGKTIIVNLEMAFFLTIKMNEQESKGQKKRQV